MNDKEMNNTIVKMLEAKRDLYIEEWGIEPEVIEMHPLNRAGLERLGVVDTVAGLRIISNPILVVGHFKLSGYDGGRR